MANYGLPYMGSKNSLVEDIIPRLPKAKNFYDLFCGGCSITHGAMLSKRWEHFVINDINGEIPQLFLDSVHGKYRNEKRWISREDFERLKDTDTYVSLCWSFGNNRKCYLYGKSIEPYKKAMHYAILFDDYSLLWALGINIPKQNGCKNYHEKRLKVTQAIKQYAKLKRTPELQSLESLERLERLERLELRIGSYDEVEFKPDSVLYCDIPYENTAEYVGKGAGFDHKRFYDWACRQKELVVISSYDISDKRFQRVVNFKKMSLLNNTGDTKTQKDEGLFISCDKLELWKTMKLRQ